MPAAESTVSEADLASLMKVTRPAVTLWRKAGCPFRRKAGRYEYVVAEVVDWRIERAVQTERDRAIRGEDGEDPKEHAREMRRRREAAETRSAEIREQLDEVELAKTLGAVVTIGDYRTAIARVLDRLTARLRAMPVRLSHLGTEVEAAVETETERVVVELHGWDEDVVDEASSDVDDEPADGDEAA